MALTSFVYSLDSRESTNLLFTVLHMLAPQPFKHYGCPKFSDSKVRAADMKEGRQLGHFALSC